MDCLRTIASVLLVTLLFVSSGAALYEHERIEHRSVEPSAAETCPASASSTGTSSVTTVKTLAKSPHDRAPTRGVDDDCAVCFQLLHVAALVTLVFYLLALVGRRLAIVSADPDSPLSATTFTPRSSRGPPLAPVS